MKTLSNIADTFKKFSQDNSGATAIEYGLIAGMIFLVLATSASTLGGKTSHLFNGIANSFDAASAGADLQGATVIEAAKRAMPGQ